MEKAYSVQETFEHTGAIIFAERNIEARKWGAGEFNDGELGGLMVYRAPWADRYREYGKIPASEMIAHGWWFECVECGERLSEDWLYDNRRSLDDIIGHQGGAVFCCTGCARRFYSIKRRRKAEEQRAIDAFKGIVRRRFPDAVFNDSVEDDSNRFSERHHAYVIPGKGGWHWQQVVVSFQFPGMKYGAAQLMLNETRSIGPALATFSCCNGDKEAFEAFAEQQKTLVKGAPR
ncbi:hypothetical protein [Labrenzia sp. R5_0]|uniref:hypothetical protein n=1 Tax=Labrenzia sp. R5_0 TaxID=2821108 RepID=UPI001ADCBD59|nr:hypothetical protein [Labrenzia sp. R5_0]MBO9459007.1 hypothetical protein [Labrenzia sp. R5_0]